MDTNKHDKRCRMDGDFPGGRSYDVKRCAECRRLSKLAKDTPHRVELTDDELVEVRMALQMHRNWIETHNPHLSAGDVQQGHGKSVMGVPITTIRALGDDQLDLIARIRSILSKLEK